MDDVRTTLRVLLVDDDPDDVFLVQDMLAQSSERNRFVVDNVDTLGAALEALRRHEHDVVLVDYQLGGDSGLDLLRATADDPERPPLVVLTGHGSPEIDQRCLDAGAADFLTKRQLDAESLERSLRYTVERYRLFRLLAKRELEYRQLFDSSPMPMWLFEPTTLQMLDVNDAALRQYGYTREEFLALTPLDLRDEQDHARFLALNRSEPFNPEQVRYGIWKHRRKDGSALDVDIVRRDLRVGDAVHRLILAYDVTARVGAEAALRASEATLRHVLQDLAEDLLVLGEDDRILFANPSACALLGQSEGALVGQLAPAALLRASDDVEELTDAAGDTHWLEVRARSTVWNGQPARVVTALDVTERRDNRHQLTLLRRTIEAANVGVIVVDARAPDQPLIYVNPAFERITGYSAAEVAGRNCRFLQRDDRAQPELDVLRRALAQQRSCEVTLRNYRKDGSLFWNRLKLSPLPDSTNSISHFIGIQTDITAQKTLEDQRDFLATHDALTGLAHFTSASVQIEQLLLDAFAESRRMALMFVDFDGFHAINDMMGFAVGDAALHAMATRLVEIAGAHAVVTRYAGDEFVVAIGDLDPGDDLLALATSFCERLADPLPVPGFDALYLTASVGISAFPDNGDNVLDLTRQAEIATRRAKQGGRNVAFAFGQSLREQLDDRLVLGRRMRDALARGEFLLHYQPQVNAQSGQLIALEALVRWNSPELGPLMPRRFIPVAEANGLILPLGDFVLREACRQLREWNDQGLSGFVMSVNVSAAQMQRPNFVAGVQKAISDSGIAAGTLELELTETVLMDNIENAIAQMKALRQLGVRLALDDFGVGHSSLSYLQRLPLDKLKIDQSFVADIARDGADAALVRAIIAMGHHLGLRVVAEGVETAAQQGYLKRCHCDQFQGNYFAAAMPAEEIPALLRKQILLPASIETDVEGRTLLILDDEENIRRSLVRLLRSDGYRILEAGNAADAFDLLAVNRIQVIISDQLMPGISGTEFLSQVKEMYPDTVRIVLSGFTDLSSVTAAINRGAIYKYLTKPWDDDDLRSQVLAAFRRADQGGDSAKAGR